MLGQTPFPIGLPIHSQADLMCPSLLTSPPNDITNLEDMIGETAKSNETHAPETLVSPETLATIEIREKPESLAKLARIAITVRYASSVIIDLLMLLALIDRESTLIVGDRSTAENRRDLTHLRAGMTMSVSGLGILEAVEVMSTAV